MNTFAGVPSKPIARVAEELLASSGFLMARLGLAFKATALERIEEEGFDAHHYSVLAILAEGARENQATIAEALAFDPSRLVGLLDSLEERGAVVRERDPQDRRRHVVTITPVGRKELQRLRAIAKEVEDEFFGPLSADDRETLHSLLARLACARDPRCGYAPVPEPEPAAATSAAAHLPDDQPATGVPVRR
jgi:DNA-binding MarR family transcriptional regulator